MNSTTSEDNFPSLLETYCREAPQKDEVIEAKNPKKGKIDTSKLVSVLYPTTIERETFLLSATLSFPGENILGKDLVDKIKEVHYNKKRQLVVPAGLTYAMMRGQLWRGFDGYSANLVYRIFGPAIKTPGDKSFQKVVKKQQKIKDAYRDAITEGIMYHLKFERIARYNFFMSEEVLVSLGQIIANTIKKNLCILLNHKYRNEIKRQHISGKRRRPSKYQKTKRTFIILPRRLGYQYSSNGTCHDSVDFSDYGDPIQEAYYRRDEERLLSRMKYNDNHRNKQPHK